MKTEKANYKEALERLGNACSYISKIYVNSILIGRNRRNYTISFVIK